MDGIVKINKLTYRYDESFIFDKFSLEIAESEWVTISGPNGSGKSTLVKILLGLQKTDSDIIINGNDIHNVKEIRKNIGVIFDNIDNNFVCETIADDIAFALENLNYPQKEINKRVNEISDILQIRNLLDKSPNDLSGGEKIKCALAVALSHNPKILIIDGALSSLDTPSKIKILKILKDFNIKGLTIINITQDLSESYDSNRLIIISNGSIVLEGTPLKVMEYDKILNKIGIRIPFEIELSIKLKLYGLIDELFPSTETLVDKLWE